MAKEAYPGLECLIYLDSGDQIRPAGNPPWIPLDAETQCKLMDAFLNQIAIRCPSSRAHAGRFINALYGGIALADSLGGCFTTQEIAGERFDATWKRWPHTYRISIKTMQLPLLNKKNEGRTVVVFNRNGGVDNKGWVWPSNAFDYLMALGGNPEEGVDVLVIPEAAVREGAQIGPDKVVYKIHPSDAVDSIRWNSETTSTYWSNRYSGPPSLGGQEEEKRVEYQEAMWVKHHTEAGRNLLAAARNYIGQDISPRQSKSRR